MEKIYSQDNRDIKLAVELYKNNELSKAYEKLLKLANAGSARAQYAVAMLHYDGKGCEKDHMITLHYLRLSAMQKFRPAIFHYSLLTGEGKTSQIILLGFEMAIEGSNLGFTDLVEFCMGSAS